MAEGNRELFAGLDGDESVRVAVHRPLSFCSEVIDKHVRDSADSSVMVGVLIGGIEIDADVVVDVVGVWSRLGNVGHGYRSGG